MRWDLIERFEILKKGDHARAVKSFSGKEDFFEEHDPGHPRMPEPLFLEMIAQTGGVLFGLGIDFKKEVILAKIGQGRFYEPVPPPCDFTIDAAIDDAREEGAWISGTVKSGERLVAEASILLVTMDALDASHSQRIVFNENFLKHYGIFQVVKSSGAAV